MSAYAQESRGKLIVAALSGGWRNPPPPLDLSPNALRDIYPLLFGLRAAPLVWRRIRNSGLRESPAASEFHQAYLFSTLQAAIREQSVLQSFKLLRSIGVEPMLIKGWAIARQYPEAGLRPYGDIDLCVHPKQLSAAKTLFDYPENKRINVDFEHEEIDKLDTRTWDDLYDRSQLVRLGEVDVRILGAEDHLRVLCIHFLKEGARSAINLCDIALAIESRPMYFDWQYCLGSSQPQANWIARSLNLAHQLLKAKVDDTPFAEDAQQSPDWLAPMVIKQWGLPFRKNEPRFKTYLGHPVKMLKGLRTRWPNPLEAALSAKEEINDEAQLTLQLAAYLAPSRIKNFLR